ncbi:penicillin-binding transpeptidase domain-containing protein [Clostridium grantii]|uniref:Cell division protein FtsI/penicillin-binding protein 2 n=1 Tax=Clostridium grantii DSM 8605 TaxID=1121316 RepID=A0A1M5QRF0_9CLOT|nr:penicillin-binding transpeptidase domain-containing protein [Clostridium grantii]SHH16704.1 Cell division protein FtsI/penicillin-binding protein 2 [Clostridium grantii DSM 8605]
MYRNGRSEIKKRIVTLFLVFLGFFSYLIYKIVVIQYVQKDKLVSMTNSQFSISEKVGDLNYSLLDCNGKNLLNYKDKYYIIIDPYTFAMNNYNTRIDDLYSLDLILRNYNSEYDLRKINMEDKSKKIRWEIDLSAYNKIMDIKGVKGFYITKDSVVDRDEDANSIENIISSNFAYDSLDGKLKMKNENSLESFIEKETEKNEYLYSLFEKNTEGTIESKGFVIPKDNINVKLTIDKEVSDKVKEVMLSEQYKDFNQIGVVIMEADSGKIKAMVQKDDKLPNINLGISTNNGYYPGSIMKVVVEEAALEAKTTSLEKMYRNNYNFQDHLSLDYMNVETAFIVSSNNVFAEVGTEVGINNINNLISEYGMFEKVLNIDSEAKGTFEGDVNEIGDTRLASFGQKHRITILHALAIPNTVINQGVYVKPYIVDSFVDINGNVIKKFETESKKILTKDTANIMKNQMVKVVRSEMGTGKQAYSSYIYLGGKTGTAERMDNGILLHDGWFVGFFTIEDKNYSMVVFSDNIGTKSGGEVCAPIFKSVVEKVYEELS